MATKKQKEHLVKVLKFVPVKARVYIQGYGGECYMGRVSREEYEAYKQGRVDLEQYANDWDDDGKWVDIPEKLRIFAPGQPYDCDNLFHESGATMDDGSYITIEDEHGKIVFESTLNVADLISRGVNVVLSEEVRTEEMPDGTVIYWGGQGEKGIFFDGEFTLDAPFEASKLTLFYSNGDGWLLSGGVEYNGKDIEGADGYSTTGKWVEHKFHIIGDELVYEGVERDEFSEDEDEDESDDGDDELDIPVLENEETWAQRVTDEYESTLSPWHPGYLEPVHKGFYDVEYESGSWPFSIDDRIKWTGKKWQHNRGGDTAIKRWRGLKEPAK